MASQSIEYTGVGTDSESPLHGPDIVRALRRNIGVILNIVLVLARVLFSSVLLNSVVNWNDDHWTVIHGLALIPLGWAVLATILMLTGQFRWKTGGRIMAVTDMIVSAAVIVFFPVYTLSALALAVLSATFMFLRHSGRFGALLLILPLAAMLVRPLGILEMLGFDWPVSYVSAGIAGEIVAFLLSSFAALFSTLIIIHIRMVEQPLTFKQPWEQDFTLGVDEHSIAPIIDCIQRLYPGSALVCILDDPSRRKEGKSIISNSSISRSNITPLRSQLTDYADHGRQPVIVELVNRVQIDIGSGQHSPIAASLEKMGRGLTGLGFDSGVLFDFKLGDTRGRLFFATGTPVEEALRNDMISLAVQLDRFFGDATKWEERRKAMMALARDLARRDLHDGILQSLAALKMRLVTIISHPDFSSNPDIEGLRKTVDFVTVEQSRLRALLHNDEGDDDSVDLVEAIEVCLKTLSLQWEVSVRLASQEPALSVDRESAENIEYLVREIIANAIRHAGAKQLTFAMALSKGNLMMTLKDELSAPNAQTGTAQAAREILASRSLSQRLEMVNGHAYSEGLEDSTLLAINIPMDFTEND
ncbi:sensor histidine kinase [Tritonibacter scottomollicae]|uniref:sensor histidine kinase n=1 Tax=Tritonibacter scottomollicae TaxID=483013 RepID=UPI003AA8E347